MRTLPKSFRATGFIKKQGKMTSLTIFVFFSKKREIITKCDNRRKLHEFQNNYHKMWQKVITKCDRYHKVRQSSLQSVAGIMKSHRRLLQSLTGMTMIKKWEITDV